MTLNVNNIVTLISRLTDGPQQYKLSAGGTGLGFFGEEHQNIYIIVLYLSIFPIDLHKIENYALILGHGDDYHYPFL